MLKSTRRDTAALLLPATYNEAVGSRLQHTMKQWGSRLAAATLIFFAKLSGQ